MSRVVANLLRQFGPITGGGSPPSKPTLTLTDKGDGTGATAAISGSDPGTTNTVYTASSPCVVGSVPRTAAGSRTGDGTLSLALSPGWYIAYCVSSSGSLVSLPSNDYEVDVTGPTSLTPAGPLALPEDQLRTLVSQSSTFYTRVGCPSPACALSKIFRTFKRLPSDAAHRSLRPYGVILSTQGLRYVLDAGGDKNYLLPEATIGVLLTDNDRYPQDVESGGVDFKNFVGGVMVDLEAQAAVSGNLAIIGMELIALRRQPEDAELAQGIWWEAVIAVEWQA
ncbi:MAG TPA: hypothetical protein VGX78_16945 [Pirellulales bacterium]|jgi:hypothetical protein|nr:hypothetical protein [Pirellulales bacterium]